MVEIEDLIHTVREEGYDDTNAEAKVGQDIILKAIANSALYRNITIKGGVVMRNISHNKRRTTLDIDMDFIKYSLSDDAIQKFVDTLNNLDGISIKTTGTIEELKQQDYHGKRVYVNITDNSGFSIKTKIDLGVHKDLAISQEEYCFDVCLDDDGASLLVNSKEQMFTEKLISLLKFGAFSKRYKDIFDLYYLGNIIDKNKLLYHFDKYIFSNPEMRENNIEDIRRRMQMVFDNKNYVRGLKNSKRNWLDEDIDTVLLGIQEIFVKLSYSKS